MELRQEIKQRLRTARSWPSLIEELEREVRLAFLLLDHDVFAIVDFDGVALGAELRGER